MTHSAVRTPYRFLGRGAVLVVAAFVTLFAGAPAASAAGRVPAAAPAATPGCAPVITDLRTAIQNAPHPDAEPGSLEEQDRNLALQRTFETAGEQHPECADDIETFVQTLAAQARREHVVKGTPFWGPIGWLWNSVYYRVFNGNAVMMSLFGWALVLSPFILALSLYWALRGSRGAFHRPYVPEHLRTEN